MDILTHAVSGAIVGTAIAPFGQNGPVKKGLIILCGAIAGVLPDMDAISMWSGFDSTFGRFFGLALDGKTIYSGKLWYSHHCFFHSFASGLLFSVLLALVLLIVKAFKKEGNRMFIKLNICYLTAIFFGYLAHLLGDLPTPGSSWGGIQLFFPSKAFVGGYGSTWWWNNYDIFLLIIAGIFINLLIILINKKNWLPRLRFGPLIILFLVFFSIIIQLNRRNFDFAYSGYTKEFGTFEQNSKEIQKVILGPSLYDKMEKFDNCMPFNF